MPRFPGVDYLLIDSLFTEQELLVRQTARQFVDERVAAADPRLLSRGPLPCELIPEMGRLGFFGANLEGYGCAGMSNVEYGLIMQEIERGDSGLRSFVSVQGALVMYPILTYGSEEQKQRWLPKLQSGEAIGCFGLTEPGFGSNPAGMLTRARRDGQTGCSTARRPGSPTAPSPTSRWCGLAPRMASADSWWSAERLDSRLRNSRQAVDARFGDLQPGVPNCRVPESAMLPGARD